MSREPSPRRTRRQRILEAAIEVFADRGYDGTTISEIERRVGLAAGTGSLYRHFASKGELLQAAVEYEVARCRAESEAAREAAPHLTDPAERQAQRFRWILEDLGRFDRLFRLMLNDGSRVPELAHAVWTAVGRPVGRRARNDGDVLEAVALTSLGGYHLFSLMQGRPFNDIPPERLVAELARMTGALDGAEQPAAS